MRYKNINSNVFLDLWPVFSVRLRESLDEYQIHMKTLWPREIDDILILMKLFPPKAGKKPDAESFFKAIENLFVFRQLVKKKSKANFA